MQYYQNPPKLDFIQFCHNISIKYAAYNLPTTRFWVMLGKGLDGRDWITVRKRPNRKLKCSRIYLSIFQLLFFLYLYFYISKCWASYLVGWEWIIVGGRSPQNYSLGDKYIDLQLPCSSQTFPSKHLICHLPLFHFFLFNFFVFFEIYDQFVILTPGNTGFYWQFSKYFL